MKKLFIGGVVLLLILAGGYVVFTLKSGEELNEASPLSEETQQIVREENEAVAPMVKDNLETMEGVEKQEFVKQVEEMRDVVMEKIELMPSQASFVAQGDFMPRFHGVEGAALLIEDNKKHIVRFENFKTDNGPQLHIYLSSDLSNDDFVDLGPIKATKGNVNYSIPEGTDINKYRYVLVWCKPFGILFSYADLVKIP